MKIEDENDMLMAMCAHRYCLGRMTYVVGACIEWLMRTWPQFDVKAKHVMLRDTIEAIVACRVGSAHDAERWLEAAKWMASQEEAKFVEGVRLSVSHIGGHEIVRSILSKQST